MLFKLVRLESVQSHYLQQRFDLLEYDTIFLSHFEIVQLVLKMDPLVICIEFLYPLQIETNEHHLQMRLFEILPPDTSKPYSINY